VNGEERKICAPRFSPPPSALKFYCISKRKKLYCSTHFIFEKGGDMAENNAVTKEDLKNILNELWDKVTGRFEASDRKFDEFRSEVTGRFEASDRKADEFRSEVTGRFEASDRKADEFRGEVTGRFEAVDRRFDRSDRERRAFREEVNNRFHEIEGKIMNRFDLAQEHTDETVAKSSREMTTKLDREAAVIDNFRLEQMTMGAVQNEMRDDLDETKKSHGAEIKNLKRRVTALEKEVFSSSAGKN
jgi:phosphate-selective porin